MDERPVEGGFDRYRGQYGSEAEANETVAVAAAMAAAMATWTLTWKASSTGVARRKVRQRRRRWLVDFLK